MIRFLRKILSPLLIVMLLASNALSLLNADFHDALYGLLANAVPQKWLSNSPTRLARASEMQRKRVKSKVKKITRKVAKRTLRNITMNVAGVPMEMIPFVGEALVVSITLSDIKDACQDMKDMNQLEALFSIETDEKQTDKVCGFKIPG